jgi:transcriptional regulator with XRE-family HTH domain
MAHTTRYAFKGGSRLAADAGLSRSALNRLINGLTSPTFNSIYGITQALEKQLHRHLDPRELVSIDGTYPTPSVCELVGCKGCLPDEAYDENEKIKPEYSDVRPGRWSDRDINDAVKY